MKGSLAGLDTGYTIIETAVVVQDEAGGAGRAKGKVTTAYLSFQAAESRERVYTMRTR